jgi:hypothetical protein
MERLPSVKTGFTTEARKHGEDLSPLCSTRSPEKTLREVRTGRCLYGVLYQVPVVDEALCQIRATLAWGEHGKAGSSGMLSPCLGASVVKCPS